MTISPCCNPNFVSLRLSLGAGDDDRIGGFVVLHFDAQGGGLVEHHREYVGMSFFSWRSFDSVLILSCFMASVLFCIRRRSSPSSSAICECECTPEETRMRKQTCWTCPPPVALDDERFQQNPDVPPSRRGFSERFVWVGRSGSLMSRGSAARRRMARGPWFTGWHRDQRWSCGPGTVLRSRRRRTKNCCLGAAVPVTCRSFLQGRVSTWG